MLCFHDDIIKWQHFPRYLPFVWGIQRSSVNSPHKGQWRGALMFSSICACINCWVNNDETPSRPLWPHRNDLTYAHDDVFTLPVKLIVVIFHYFVIMLLLNYAIMGSQIARKGYFPKDKACNFQGKGNDDLVNWIRCHLLSLLFQIGLNRI